jgi:hypothetical protein
MVDFLDVTWSESTQYNKSQMSHPVLSNKLRQKLSFTISQTWKPCANLIISIENMDNWNHNPHNLNMHVYIYVYILCVCTCWFANLLKWKDSWLSALVQPLDDTFPPRNGTAVPLPLSSFGGVYPNQLDFAEQVGCDFILVIIIYMIYICSFNGDLYDFIVIIMS